jgi:hypothetical protein
VVIVNVPVTTMDDGPGNVMNRPHCVMWTRCVIDARRPVIIVDGPVVVAGIAMSMFAVMFPDVIAGDRAQGAADQCTVPSAYRMSC